MRIREYANELVLKLTIIKINDKTRFQPLKTCKQQVDTITPIKKNNQLSPIQDLIP